MNCSNSILREGGGELERERVPIFDVISSAALVADRGEIQVPGLPCILCSDVQLYFLSQFTVYSGDRGNTST